MSLLYRTPLVVLGVAVLLLLLLALETGHRISRRLPVAHEQGNTIAGPVLALVGLLLAFSYGMADSRFTKRREASVAEANAIEKYWLRTSLLAEPARTASREALRKYVNLHVERRRAGIDLERRAEVEAQAERLEDDLWALLISETREEPEAQRVRLLVPALNELIDEGEVSRAAQENHIPDPIIAYLLALVAVAGMVVGYRPLEEKRNPLLWCCFTLVLGGVVLVLLDLDRPLRGFVRDDVTPLQELRESLRHEPP